MKILSLEVELFHADGQTGRRSGKTKQEVATKWLRKAKTEFPGILLLRHVNAIFYRLDPLADEVLYSNFVITNYPQITLQLRCT
jgi:hypothetical protein